MLRDNLLPLGTAAIIVAIISLAGWLLGFEVTYSIYSFPMLVFGPSLVIVPLLGLILLTLWRERPARPTAFIVSKFTTDWRGLERASRGLPILLAFPVFISVFTSYKAALGHIVPFYFDPAARYIDEVLHGGDAWRLYTMLTGSPALTFALNVVYNLWFFVMFAVLAFCTFVVTDMRERSQFLVAFLLSWFLVGVVAATALSSAGPCFYEYFFGDAHYDYITQYLRSVAEHYPVPALDVQQHILDFYKETETGLGAGISAAPSMHVSVATLVALFLSRHGRLAATLGWSYCLIIQWGSVQLGWHYAIDGYIAIIMTVLIWKASGTLVNAMIPAEARHVPTPALRPFT